MHSSDDLHLGSFHFVPCSLCHSFYLSKIEIKWDKSVVSFLLRMLQSYSLDIKLSDFFTSESDNLSKSTEQQQPNCFFSRSFCLQIKETSSKWVTSQTPHQKLKIQKLFRIVIRRKVNHLFRNGHLLNVER